MEYQKTIRIEFKMKTVFGLAVKIMFSENLNFIYLISFNILC